MSDETVNISARTWSRSIEPINKDGYSEGVVDGQTAAFQSSFDMGYRQGFEFGYKLGLKKAETNQTQETSEDTHLDRRRVNCQICLTNNISNENIVNLYNRQLEKNKSYFPVQQNL